MVINFHSGCNKQNTWFWFRCLIKLDRWPFHGFSEDIFRYIFHIGISEKTNNHHSNHKRPNYSTTYFRLFLKIRSVSECLWHRISSHFVNLVNYYFYLLFPFHIKWHCFFCFHPMVIKCRFNCVQNRIMYFCLSMAFRFSVFWSRIIIMMEKNGVDKVFHPFQLWYCQMPYTLSIDN